MCDNSLPVSPAQSIYLKLEFYPLCFAQRDQFCAVECQRSVLGVGRLAGPAPERGGGVLTCGHCCDAQPSPADGAGPPP